MSVKTLRTLILAGNLVLGLALVATAGVTFLESLKQEVPDRKPKKLPKAGAKNLPQRIKPIGTYAAIWDMRATPGDNVEKEVVVQPPEPDEDRARRALQGLLSIAGIVFNRTVPKNSYAVLNLGRSARTVSPGETVEDAEVVQIRRDDVEFLFQGFHIVLGMSGGTPYGRPGIGVPPRVGRKADLARPVRPAPPQPGQPFNATVAFKGSRRIAENHWQIERAEVQYVQTNQRTLINQFSPTPAIGRDGRQMGVELKKIPANSYASQRGLKQGDIVKSINGIPVNSMDFASLGRRLKGSRTLTVVVLRRGQSKTLTFNLR